MLQERAGLRFSSLRDRLLVLKTTAGFARLSGPLPEGFPLSLMLRGGQQFMRWLRAARNSTAVHPSRAFLIP